MVGSFCIGILSVIDNDTFPFPYIILLFSTVTIVFVISNTIKNRIGFIINNVFVFMSMPLENTTGPESLTEEELDLLDCWIGNGAPNN